MGRKAVYKITDKESFIALPDKFQGIGYVFENGNFNVGVSGWSSQNITSFSDFIEIKKHRQLYPTV